MAFVFLDIKLRMIPLMLGSTQHLELALVGRLCEKPRLVETLD
jgi:hypothetical protein